MWDPRENLSLIHILPGLETDQLKPFLGLESVVHQHPPDGDGGCLQFFGRFFKPVSYTHLDVYKRQEYGGFENRKVCSMPFRVLSAAVNRR